MTTWNKQTSTILAQKSVAVLWHCYRSKDKIPRTLKRFVCKLLRFLLRRSFCRQNWYYAQHYTSSISRYFHYNRASRSQKGKILRWNKHAGHQAEPVRLWVFTACKQLEKPREKMRIHLGCSTTHARAKLVLASYADILWARHAIFLPHERLLKRMGTFLTLCSKRSAREHVEITEEPIDAWLLFNGKPIISYDRTTPQEGD